MNKLSIIESLIASTSIYYIIYILIYNVYYPIKEIIEKENKKWITQWHKKTLIN